MKMNVIDRQAVLDVLSRLVTPGIRLTALADDLGVRKHEYASLRATVLELVEDGVVQVLPGGAFALVPRGRTADPKAIPPPLPQPPPKPRPRPLPRAQPAPRVAATKPPTEAPG